MTPLISVIVPAYNIESYIGRCIESIVAQTYKKLEIIVVNDGSTDNTGAVIDKYADVDKRIVAIHQKNGGVSSARNAGIEVAKGEYIGFVDGDDTIDNDMYEILLKNILEYDADISCCRYKVSYVDKVPASRSGSGKIVLRDNLQGVKNFFLGANSYVWTQLYRANLFDTVRFNGMIKWGEDCLVNYYLFSKSSKSVYVDEIKYTYVRRNDSATLSKTSFANMYDLYLVSMEILHETTYKREFYQFAFSMYLKMLISIVISPDMSSEHNGKIHDEYIAFRNKIQKELKENIGLVIKSKELTLKSKIHAIGGLYFYPVYFYIRKMYHILSGKKILYENSK